MSTKNTKTAKVVIASALIVCAIVAGVLLVTKMIIIPNGKYNDAVALMEAGNLDEAQAAFRNLGKYKDSVEKVADIQLTITKEQLKNAKVGDYVSFGSYEQDNDTANGAEDIEWLVLEKSDDKILAISKYALDCKPYNTEFSYVTWETCSLREWLNSDFINAAFSNAEKELIPTVTVSADQNPQSSTFWVKTDSGNATQDQIFLLSITEANKYFDSGSAWQCELTDYAVANSAYINTDYGFFKWWLRTTGGMQSYVATVFSGAGVYELGDVVNSSGIAVRPAIWINLDF